MKKENANYRTDGSVIIKRSPVSRRFKKPYRFEHSLNKNISTLN